MATRKKRANFKIIGLVLIILAPFLIAVYAYYIEPFWIKTASFQINNIGLEEKIVFVSDTHYGDAYSKAKLEKVVALINRQNADVVIFGGDYIDRNPKYAPEYFEIIKNVKAKDGVYGVLGNHDMNSHLLPLVKSGLQQNGIKLMDNQGYWIEKGDKRIRVAGVGDYNYGTQDSKKALGADVKPSDYAILVSHHPDYFEEKKEDKANLYLAGHLHGGQIGLGFWHRLLPSNYGKKFIGGRAEADLRTIITSKGIGMSTIPFRFGARPDIVVINLK